MISLKAGPFNFPLRTKKLSAELNKAYPPDIYTLDDIDRQLKLFYHFSDKRPEQSIAAARASVMVYDDLNKKWVPAGSSHGLSKVTQQR